MKGWYRGAVLLMLSCYGPAEACKSSDQTGKVFKVIEQDVSSEVRGGPQQAFSDESSAPKGKTQTLRTGLFIFGNKRYSLLLPSDARDTDLSPGQSVCLREEDGAVHIVTASGRVLHGIPRPLPTLPANKKPGVSARPDRDK